MTLEEKIAPYLEMHEKAQKEKGIISDNSIKKMPLERRPSWIDFEEKIGNTNYVVKSFFDDNSNEDIMKKIVRLMNNSKVNCFKE